MRILGLGANQFNSRDGVIVQGVKSLLNVPDFTRYVLIDDHNYHQPNSDFYPNEKFDLIVYCGTPWLWDQMQHSPKYHNTLRAIKTHPEARVVWLGIGSSLYCKDATSGILRSSSDQLMLQKTFQGHEVVVRDSLAHDILSKASVPHQYLPCPSYFFVPDSKSSSEVNIAFYHAPQTGIASGDWKKEKLEQYNELFKKFVTDNSAEVVVCEKEEVPIAAQLFGTAPTLISTWQETFSWCKRANKVLSGRVHNAVPSIVFGAEVGIVPVDSRARVVTDFWDVEVIEEGGLKKIQKCDISFDMGVYSWILK